MFKDAAPTKQVRTQGIWLQKKAYSIAVLNLVLPLNVTNMNGKNVQNKGTTKGKNLILLMNSL